MIVMVTIIIKAAILLEVKTVITDPQILIIWHFVPALTMDSVIPLQRRVTEIFAKRINKDVILLRVWICE